MAKVQSILLPTHFRLCPPTLLAVVTALACRPLWSTPGKSEQLPLAVTANGNINHQPSSRKHLDLILNRDGQRSFELLALISSPQTKNIPQPPFGQTGQPLIAFTVAEILQGIFDFSLVVLHKRTSKRPMGTCIKDSNELSLIQMLPL